MKQFLILRVLMFFLLFANHLQAGQVQRVQRVIEVVKALPKPGVANPQPPAPKMAVPKQAVRPKSPQPQDPKAARRVVEEEERLARNLEMRAEGKELADLELQLAFEQQQLMAQQQRRQAALREARRVLEAQERMVRNFAMREEGRELENLELQFALERRQIVAQEQRRQAALRAVQRVLEEEVLTRNRAIDEEIRELQDLELYLALEASEILAKQAAEEAEEDVACPVCFTPLQELTADNPMMQTQCCRQPICSDDLAQAEQAAQEMYRNVRNADWVRAQVNQGHPEFVGAERNYPEHAACPFCRHYPLRADEYLAVAKTQPKRAS